MAAANTFGRQVVDVLTNKSGGGVVAGDVVIVDTGNDAAFTTTTSARSETSIGIVQETIANNASGRVLIAGRAALVNVPASVTRGHYVETHTVAKQATGSATRRSGSFGQFLTGGTTPTAVIWGTTDQTASVAAAITSDSARVETDQTTTSATFGDLATAGPAVTVTVNTACLVIVTGSLYGSTTGTGGRMGWAASSANTIAAADAKSINYVAFDNGSTNEGHMSGMFRLTGLTPGSTVFTAKYRRSSGSGDQHFRYREIAVILLD
jgi:hypothetical protein